MSDQDATLIQTSLRTITQARTQVVQSPAPQPVTQLTGSAAAVYTAPNPTGTPVGSICRSILYQVTLTNTDVAARTVTLYIVPAAGSASTANTILPTVSMPAGAMWVVDFGTKGIPMVNGSMLQGKASVTLVVNCLPTVDEFN